MGRPAYRIGCAGWNVPREPDETDPSGSHLQRYARRFNAVEINSSFYRAHRETTWQRWAASVPQGFLFSAKVPKVITHDRRLVECEALISEFVAQVSPLGDALGPLLVQLPPSLTFEAGVAARFFTFFRSCYHGPLVVEPRHASWFADDANDLLVRVGAGRVAADPAVVAAAATPGGGGRVAYFRMHGSPRIYSSSYDREQLMQLAHALTASSTEFDSVWCIFDNTTLGAAVPNATALMAF